MTTTIENIITAIQALEDVLEVIKESLVDYSNLDQSDKEKLNSFEFPFEKLRDASSEFRRLKKAIKRVFRGSQGFSSHGFGPKDFSFDLDFDFSEIGRTIEHTVKSALEGLEEGLGGLEGMLDFDFGHERRRKKKSPRQKVNPGKEISYGEMEDHADEVLPNIDEISNGLRILETLGKGILSSQDLAKDLNVSGDELTNSLAKLVELGLVLQEKSGLQRYLLTRKGKQLKELSTKEETNN